MLQAREADAFYGLIGSTSGSRCSAWSVWARTNQPTRRRVETSVGGSYPVSAVYHRNALGKRCGTCKYERGIAVEYTLVTNSLPWRKVHFFFALHLVHCATKSWDRSCLANFKRMGIRYPKGGWHVPLQGNHSRDGARGVGVLTWGMSAAYTRVFLARAAIHFDN